MKKISLYIFLVLMWCNVSNAGILDQSQYLCKTKDNIARTEINILKKYNEDHFLVSENFGFGEIVAFSKIEKDSIKFFILNDSLGSLSVIEGILGPIKNNKSGSYREYNSNMYGLKESQFNELMSSNPKFGDAKKNTIKEIWNSNRHKELRKIHTDGNRKKKTPCDRCGIKFK